MKKLLVFTLFISICACTHTPPKKTFAPPPKVKKTLPPLPQIDQEDRINPNEDPSVLPTVDQNSTSN